MLDADSAEMKDQLSIGTALHAFTSLGPGGWEKIKVNAFPPQDAPVNLQTYSSVEFEVVAASEADFFRSRIFARRDIVQLCKSF